MPAKKKMSMSGPPKKGERALRIKKKGAPVREARPPAPGERKALRKRIILSNTNALDVPGLRDLNKESMVDEKAVGQVLGVPGETVDSLRAVEAFKVGQGWGFFRRPACLVRKETVALGGLMGDTGKFSAEGQTVRRVICGERGTGKSVLLLQAMAMAFLREWVVINFPEGQYYQL
jgi:small subunit ribosomal protein S29